MKTEYVHPTARDQFVEDYTLVVDNDFKSYTKAMAIVKANNSNMVAISDIMKEKFESYISEVAERERKAGNEAGSLLIQQLLLNWGNDAWDRIARHYIEKE